MFRNKILSLILALLLIASLTTNVMAETVVYSDSNGGKIVTLQSSDKVNNPTLPVKPNWVWNSPYVKTTSSLGYTGAGTLLTIWNNRTAYPVKYTYRVDKMFSFSFNSNVGVSAEVVSAGVGFNVTGSYTVSETNEITVPAYKTVQYWIGPVGTKYNFNVYKPYATSSGYYLAGSGSATRITGKKYTLQYQ